MKRLSEEAIQLFDGGETRSFAEIYGDNNALFNEGIDDIIDPKMKKLFEATYQTGNIQQKRLKEAYWDDNNEMYTIPGKELKATGLKKDGNGDPIDIEESYTWDEEDECYYPDGGDAFRAAYESKEDGPRGEWARQNYHYFESKKGLKEGDGFESIEGAADFDEDSLEELRQTLLKALPLKVKKQIKELLGQTTIEEAMRSVLVGLGVETAADAQDLSETETQQIAGSLLGLLAVADKMDMLPAIIEKGMASFSGDILHEAWGNTYEPSYSKYASGKFPKDYNPEKRSSGTKGDYPYYKTSETGEAMYLNGEIVTPGLKSKIIEKAKNIGVRIGAVLGITGLIGVAIVAILAPVAMLLQGALSLFGEKFGPFGGMQSKGLAVTFIVIGVIGLIGQAARGAAKRESLNEEFDHNFSGDEPGPSGDGVPAGHNRPGMSGADPEAVQGQGRGESNNAKLFNEATFRQIYRCSKL
jgi:hypothetical protein